MDFLPDVGLDFLPSVDVGLPSVDVGDVGGAITGAGYAGELGLNIFDAVSDANSATADGVTNAADIAKKAVVPVSWYTQHVPPPETAPSHFPPGKQTDARALGVSLFPSNGRLSLDDKVDDWNRLLRVYGDDGALEYATDGQGNGGNGVRSEDGRLLQSGRFSNPFARRHVRNGTSTAGAYGGGERGAVAAGTAGVRRADEVWNRGHAVSAARGGNLPQRGAAGQQHRGFCLFPVELHGSEPGRVPPPDAVCALSEGSGGVHADALAREHLPEVVRLFRGLLLSDHAVPEPRGAGAVPPNAAGEAAEEQFRRARVDPQHHSGRGADAVRDAQYLGEKAFMSLPSTARKALGSILSKTAFSGRDLFDIPPTQPDSRAARDVRIALLRQKQKALRHYLKQRPNLYYRGKSSKTMRKGFRIPHGWSAVGSGSGFRFETPKMGTNLLTQSPTQELLKSVNLPQDMAANPKHPWLKFDGRETAMDRFYAKPRPYVRVTLEDKSAGQVLWDAVFNMRNQRQPQLEASSTVGKVRALFTGGGRFSLGSGGDDPNFLREDATPIHGVQKKMVKICPRTTDLVPRLYTLYVRRWPQINEREDFIGRMLFQSYMTTDPLPNAMRLDYADANTYKTFVADADKKARKNSGKMLEQFFGRFMHDLENYIMKKVM
eukprot:CAMPEP_0178992456 /NCGR_PEP_ID=MMETSP0795-20121207/6124_1 /TAXON_ID=88552 /ORGANISM="Amoebophrya sp., Strain Ameob2" /LENGTH=661 /DNA_ID=CAMNT_0020684339 /DNA_START=94 /DNA_END=2079 /DNA_ORIENTATION=-